MNAETIKDFLVSLGFEIDDAGATKFDSVLAGTTANAIKMGLAVEGAALTVVGFTARLASGLDNLYRASQRTGATVQGIQSIGYAVSQVDGSVDAARFSLESLSRFVRSNPGAEGFLNRINLAGGLAGSLDILRRHILDNFPRIEQTLAKAIKSILSFGDIIGQLFFRLIEGTSDLITRWMSPVGLITALATGIALLWKDYKTWKEGGQSLIDWGKWKPEVDAALEMTHDLQKTVAELAKTLAKLLNIDPKSWSLKWDFSNFIDQMGEFSRKLNTIADLLNAIKDGRWADAASIGKKLLNQGGDKPSAMSMVASSANGTNDWIEERRGLDPRSVGRTVRGWFGDDEPEQSSQPVMRPQPTKVGSELLEWMQPMLTNLEQLYRLPAGVLRSMAITESSSDRFAVSGAGAKGLFQLIDGTARDMGLRGIDVFDPEKAAQIAAKYFSQLLQANGGDLSKALDSYNRGIGNVQKHGMALMPQETRNYIPKAMINMSGNGVTVAQKNTYYIYGGGDPRSVGTEVERRQQSANAQVMRGNQTKVG